MKTKRRIFSGALILLAILLPWLAAISSEDALVYVINIRNEIGNGLRVYIDNGIKRASEAEADAIIFDVHTPGGAVGAARDIIDAIQRTEPPYNCLCQHRGNLCRCHDFLIVRPDRYEVRRRNWRFRTGFDSRRGTERKGGLLYPRQDSGNSRTGGAETLISPPPW